MNTSPSRKIALVAGAGSGIGRSVALGLLRPTGRAIAPEPMMDAKHVADAVRHIGAMPLDVNVLNMTIMASAMPFAGRG